MRGRPNTCEMRKHRGPFRVYLAALTTYGTQASDRILREAIYLVLVLAASRLRKLQGCEAVLLYFILAKVVY